MNSVKKLFVVTVISVYLHKSYSELTVYDLDNGEDDTRFLIAGEETYDGADENIFNPEISYPVDTVHFTGYGADDMKTIPLNFFDTFPNANTVNIFFCAKRISANDFERAGHVLHIGLSRNNLPELKDSPFKHMIKLETLGLSRNRIQDIKPDAFSGLKTLNKLVLDRNELTSISSKILKPLTNLQVLDISFNKIEVLPDDLFEYNPHLNTFNAANNKITHIGPAIFSSFEHLSEVILSNNLFTSLNVPSVISKLDVQSCGLRNLHVKGVVGNLQIKNNALTEISVDDLSKTHVIHAANNMIENITNLEKAINLTELNVEGNPLSVVPSFEGLQQLKKVQPSAIWRKKFH